jgi:hypothetical protein
MTRSLESLWHPIWSAAIAVLAGLAAGYFVLLIDLAVRGPCADSVGQVVSPVCRAPTPNFILAIPIAIAVTIGVYWLLRHRSKQAPVSR